MRVRAGATGLGLDTPSRSTAAAVMSPRQRAHLPGHTGGELDSRRGDIISSSSPGFACTTSPIGPAPEHMPSPPCAHLVRCGSVDRTLLCRVSNPLLVGLRGRPVFSLVSTRSVAPVAWARKDSNLRSRRRLVYSEMQLPLCDSPVAFSCVVLVSVSAAGCGHPEVWWTMVCPGRGGEDRTPASRCWRPLPYRLATPLRTGPVLAGRDAVQGQALCVAVGRQVSSRTICGHPE